MSLLSALLSVALATCDVPSAPVVSDLQAVSGAWGGRVDEVEGQLETGDYGSARESAHAVAEDVRAARAAGSLDDISSEALIKTMWAAWDLADGAADAEALAAAGDRGAAMDAAHEAAEEARRGGRLSQRVREAVAQRMGALWTKLKGAVGGSTSALSTPLISQHAQGAYPGGYCATTALRMVLRYEGLNDPGADAVALQGSHPYIPGQGSDPARLDDRARELGLAGAAFDNTGQLSDIAAAIDAGRPVMVGGEGTFRGRYEGGGAYAHTYRSSGHWMVVVGYESDASGAVTEVVLNDPDTGRRLTSTRQQFLSFFAPDGNIWMVNYGS